VDPRNRLRLVCLALDVDAPDIVDYLGVGAEHQIAREQCAGVDLTRPLTCRFAMSSAIGVCSHCSRGLWLATRCPLRSCSQGCPASGSGAPLSLSPSAQLPGPCAGPEFEIDACGECASCRRIARGVHQDVLIVEPGDSGSIKIEQVRDVIDRAGYRPFEGRRRAVIIDEADAMVPAAQNALLKTLEEPPSASVLILVSSMPDASAPDRAARVADSCASVR
jgi:hypothetical protein